MALLCGRLTSAQIFSSLKGFPSALAACNQAQARSYKINRVRDAPKPPEDYDEKNALLNRPLSPHLSIYAPQMTTILSITHRMTGVALAGYVTILGYSALVLPGDINHYATMIESLQLSSATIFAAKFILAAPFGFHAANGIRHLNWDLGKSLNNKGVITTGYIMLIGTALITGLLTAL